MALPAAPKFGGDLETRGHVFSKTNGSGDRHRSFTGGTWMSQEVSKGLVSGFITYLRDL